MKKSLFFVAAAALALTACTSENDILETGPAKQATPQAVGFDVYTPAATTVTRAEYEGALTTSRLQDPTAGFGVYAFYSDQKNQTAYDGNYGYANLNTDHIPNFMVNEKVLWNNTNMGWYYSPLKYWPNETVNDSQDTNATMEDPTDANKRLDRLTFFAYAPYEGSPAGKGILAVTDKNGKLGSDAAADPAVSYQAEWTNPNNAVDLLWGVAPSGGLSYTAVNGTEKTVEQGMPLIDMVKPSVNTNMKFLFNHALARIGIKVVAAVDQIGAGGTLDPNTKITIKQVKLTGYFGETSKLNLNNTTPNFAKWYGQHNTVELAAGTAADAFDSHMSTITIDGDNIAQHLRYIPSGSGTYDDGYLAEQTVVGVTTTKQDLITPSTKYRTKAGSPSYSPGKKYVNEGGTEVQATYTFDAKSLFYTFETDHYVQKTSGTETAPTYPTYPTLTYYTLTGTGSYNDSSAPAGVTGPFYSRSGSGTTESPYVYAYVASPEWNGSNEYYTVEGTKSVLPYGYTGTVYTAEPNFYMVVPVENIPNICTNNWASAAQIQKLRTVTVQIEYYITTEDDKLAKERAQTRNIITKDVVFPSIENGKSYNLNLILGLTSVKLEAEVDDWKVVDVNGYLPQNTAE